MLNFEVFAAAITDLISCSSELNRDNLTVFIIINPAAGGFRRKVFFNRLLAELLDVRDREAAVEKRERLFQHRVFITAAPGDAYRQTASLRNAGISGGADKSDKEFLLITAGGDGTAAEVAQAAAEMPKHLRERITLFRLPLGTGNDGLDAATLEEAWQILLGPSGRRRIEYVVVEPRGSRPLYAFNIASVGVDGYITELANRIKKVIPGSFYSLMVDVAALFYENRIDSLELELEIGEKNSPTKKSGRKQGEYLLVAFGVSGNRTYGGGKKVLPTADNVCTIGPMNLARKFQVKNLLYRGAHDGLEETELFRADALTITSTCSLPIQCDGESRWLSKEEFPLVMRRVGPSLYVLSKL